jgi:hypothetical protein
METSAKVSFSQSVILSEARRKVLLASAGEPERSRRTSRLSPGTTETDLARSKPGWPAALSRRELAVWHSSASRPPRSFGSGSAKIFGQTHLPLAFAQDDGAFLHDGTFAEISGWGGGGDLPPKFPPPPPGRVDRLQRTGGYHHRLISVGPTGQKSGEKRLH